VRQKLTPAFVARVTPADIQKGDSATPAERKPDAHVVYWDTEHRGFGLLVLPSGEKRYVLQYRAAGRSRRMTFKPGLTLTQARNEAKAKLGAVAKGGDPLAERLAERRRQEGAATNTLKAITEEYFKREGSKLRSAEARQSVFTRLIYPAFGARQINEIKRSEIVRLLDKVQDDQGPHMAQKVLAFLSKLFNWHASRDDDFLTPIRRGMARTKLKETARDRVLSDDEIRALWRAAEAAEGPFGRLVKFLLLTATRRNEAARMTRGEVLPNGDWIIPAERMKAKQEHLIPLSPTAKAIIDGIPKLGPYVFTTAGRCPTNNFGKCKTELEAAMLAELRKMAQQRGDSAAEIVLEPWVIHDLRRTARSLMSRAKVNVDVAERCLAHVISGVRGTYDRYAYRDEKRDAFQRLAALVEHIVNPPVANVLPLRA
jgi:integrase